MNHKWKVIKAPLVKGEMEGERKRCKNCLMEVRHIRQGRPEAHRGWIEVQYREGPRGKWYSTRVLPNGKIPMCVACRTCPTCGGTGVVTREKGEKIW